MQPTPPPSTAWLSRERSACRGCTLRRLQQGRIRSPLAVQRRLRRSMGAADLGLGARPGVRRSDARPDAAPPASSNEPTAPHGIARWLLVGSLSVLAARVPAGVTVREARRTACPGQCTNRDRFHAHAPRGTCAGPRSRTPTRAEAGKPAAECDATDPRGDDHRRDPRAEARPPGVPRGRACPWYRSAGLPGHTLRGTVAADRARVSAGRRRS